MAFSQTTETQDVRILNKEERASASEIADLFTELIPTIGWIVSYALFLSNKTKKPFNTNKMFPILTRIVNSSVVLGVTVTMKATGLLDFTNDANNFNVTYFNNKLAETIENQFVSIYERKREKTLEYIEELEEKNKARNNFDSHIKEIKEYFELV